MLLEERVVVRDQLCIVQLDADMLSQVCAYRMREDALHGRQLAALRLLQDYKYVRRMTGGIWRATRKGQAWIVEQALLKMEDGDED